MFAPKVAKPQAKVAESSARRLAPQRASLAARPFGGSAIERALLLQHTIGNQATLRLLARQTSSSAGSVPAGGHEQKVTTETMTAQSPRGPSWNFSEIPLFPPERTGRAQPLSVRSAQPGLMQPKLAIGNVNDPLEQEADRVADQVMRMPAPEIAPAAAPPQLSCKCAACEEEEAMLRSEPASQAGRAAGEAPGIIDEALRTPRQPLDAAARAYFEPRFGTDFGGVRVHPEARTATAALQARAFTVGQDIVLAPGQYAPRTREGQRLLAHELTHVVQQRAAPALAGSVQCKTEPPKVPTYRDCTEEATLEDNPNPKLERARVFARNLVDAAIGALVKHDESEPYRTALARHFITPTFDRLREIHGNFRKIQSQLTPENIRCAASDADLEECFRNPEAGVEMGFNKTETSDTVLCPPFWFMSLPCKATILIHEAAHGVGIGTGAKHPPNHGSAEYPAFKPQPASETAAARTDNPDAYAHFAAHIGRETDTLCVPIAETIKIEGKAPGPGGTSK